MKCPLCKEYRCTNIKHIAYKHRLYKAAPALLEACKWINDIVSTANDGGAVWCAIRERPDAEKWAKELRAAIAAVEGKV